MFSFHRHISTNFPGHVSTKSGGYGPQHDNSLAAAAEYFLQKLAPQDRGNSHQRTVQPAAFGKESPQGTRIQAYRRDTGLFGSKLLAECRDRPSRTVVLRGLPYENMLLLFLPKCSFRAGGVEQVIRRGGSAWGLLRVARFVRDVVISALRALLSIVIGFHYDPPSSSATCPSELAQPCFTHLGSVTPSLKPGPRYMRHSESTLRHFRALRLEMMVHLMRVVVSPFSLQSFSASKKEITPARIHRWSSGQTTRFPPRRIGIDSRRIFARGNRAGRCLWSVFSGFPVSPPLHSGTAPYASHFTLIGSQDLDVKGRPNFSTPIESTLGLQGHANPRTTVAGENSALSEHRVDKCTETKWCGSSIDRNPEISRIHKRDSVVVDGGGGGRCGQGSLFCSCGETDRQSVAVMGRWGGGGRCRSVGWEGEEELEGSDHTRRAREGLLPRLFPKKTSPLSGSYGSPGRPPRSAADAEIVLTLSPQPGGRTGPAANLPSVCRRLDGESDRQGRQSPPTRISNFRDVKVLRTETFSVKSLFAPKRVSRSLPHIGRQYGCCCHRVLNIFFSSWPTLYFIYILRHYLKVVTIAVDKIWILIMEVKDFSFTTNIYQMTSDTGITMAERLARSPPTKENRAQSPAGSPDSRMWES
ncbi:hypothetical protein PR048_028937 [Dryococelus australis]|uniref:Uncharacterized protein n=1 Tax=Dryococelus australis TaxID=614101 RepID=A0ABQ9GFP4_9NEOP|nr:hypothetical protein PR048_028937 [Dryococelus australis]